MHHSHFTHHRLADQCLKKEVKAYIDEKIRNIDPNRYKQEPIYVTALLKELEGIAHESKKGIIKFRATVVDDRGTNSAEKLYGADFAITADISDTSQQVIKAIVVQAKRGAISDMSPSKKNDLKDTIRKMRSELKYKNPKIMEIIETKPYREPRILSGFKVLTDESYKSETFSDYIINRVLTTLDGNTDLRFVRRVQDSSLSQLHTLAELDPNEFDPDDFYYRTVGLVENADLPERLISKRRLAPGNSAIFSQSPYGEQLSLFDLNSDWNEQNQ